MRYCAFDQSLSASGYATIDCETGMAFTKTLKPPKGLTGGLRLAWFRKAIVDELRLDIAAVAMEHPSLGFGGNGSSDNLSELVKLAGVVEEAAGSKNLRVTSYSSSQVKLWATGSGDGGRAAIKKANPDIKDSQLTAAVKANCLTGMRRLWPEVDISTHDEADALALVHILMCSDGFMEPCDEGPRKVMAAIKKLQETPKKTARQKATLVAGRAHARAKRQEEALALEEFKSELWARYSGMSAANINKMAKSLQAEKVDA